jgi:hypothetical protein
MNEPHSKDRAQPASAAPESQGCDALDGEYRDARFAELDAQIEAEKTEPSYVPTAPRKEKRRKRTTPNTSTSKGGSQGSGSVCQNAVPEPPGAVQVGSQAERPCRPATSVPVAPEATSPRAAGNRECNHHDSVA